MTGEERNLVPSLTTLDVLEDVEEQGEAPRDWRVDNALMCVAI